jgi:hypothetical protein
VNVVELKSHISSVTSKPGRLCPRKYSIYIDVGCKINVVLICQWITSQYKVVVRNCQWKLNGNKKLHHFHNLQGLGFS